MRILSFGGGVDSSAMLLHHLNVSSLGIDAVVFADTGAESMTTYENVDRFSHICREAGLRFDIVSKQGESITDWVTRLGIVPVMRGGSHVCSVRFKGDVMAAWAREKFPGQEITWLIGIEANEAHRTERFGKPKRSKKSKQVFKYEYPLQDMGMTRDDCLALIAKHGMQVSKSSCVFCPFMSHDEIRDIRNDPDAWETIKLVERRYQEESPIKHQRWLDNGKPLIMLRTKGWRDGEGVVTPADGDVGDHCKITYKAPSGMWQKDGWAAGNRLFVRPVDGELLSVAEWEALIDAENAEAAA